MTESAKSIIRLGANEGQYGFWKYNLEIGREHGKVSVEEKKTL